jgi:TIR domain
MEDEKIFFSYSRSDSDFVLKLANHLKSAGFYAWIDQQDIKGGNRWDKAIETALSDASRVIVVLTQASVNSDHVKNEIAYALEAGKTVIPVLAEKCTPILMIIRLHRIDFTADYRMGLDELYETLLLLVQQHKLLKVRQVKLV